jgi:hypothetical protein
MLALLIAAAVAVPAAEQAAIFTAAGFSRRGSQWRTDCNDPGVTDYEPGAIETYRDLNGDGRPEAVVTESSVYCYGNTGTAFRLLTKLPTGRWKLLLENPGFAEFLPTRGVAGMPDVSIGLPGYCFPVLRWNGKAYTLNRHEYDGKPCRPPR